MMTGPVIADVPVPTKSSSNSLLLGDLPRKRRQRGAVQFGYVEILEFGPSIGNNPSVTSGVPITLSDKPIKSSSFDLADFEQLRIGQRRSTRQLHIPKEIREQMLLAQGFAKWEIVHAIRAARVARTNRKQSNDSRAIAEAVEEASRKLKRLMKGAKQPQGPCPLKLGPTNADLKGQSNPVAGTFSCDRTLTDESVSTCFTDELPNLPVRDSSPKVTPRRPITRKPSHDSLPKLPSRVSIKEDDSDSSDSEGPAHSFRRSTTLREALALNSRDDSSGRPTNHDAPKLPERRISGNHGGDDELLSDACRLVEALDAVNAMVQKQEEMNRPILLTPQEASKPQLPLYRSPSAEETGDDKEEDVVNRESTFWHSYPTEQAPQAPCRARLRAKSPVAA